MRAESFFCSLDVLYGGIGIGKLQFLIKKIYFSAVNFLIHIQIGIQHKKLNPDPDKMNTDPKHCLVHYSDLDWIQIFLSHVKLGSRTALGISKPEEGTKYMY
jgi:hypothetical protein